MSSGIKTLILIRHAHRDTDEREQDNGLSEKGLKQVSRLAKYFQKRFKFEEWQASDLNFESSEKVRCVQTLQPVAQLMGRAPHIHPGLMEQTPGESFAKFQARIENYLREWSESKALVTMACSHGDVLPLMTYKLVGAAVDFKKAGFVEIEWEAGQAQIKQAIASLKPFYE